MENHANGGDICVIVASVILIMFVQLNIKMKCIGLTLEN